LASSVDLAPMLVTLGNRGSTHWARGTTTPIRATMKLEFYDYATAAGRAETESTPDDPRVTPLLNKLLEQYAPTQMEAPLPGSLRATSRRARASYVVFSAVTNAYTYKQLIGQGKLRTVLGYGEAF
jgi:hypothetical protein